MGIVLVKIVRTNVKRNVRKLWQFKNPPSAEIPRPIDFVSMGLVFPPGVTLDVALPPFSYMPSCDTEDKQAIQTMIVASLATNFFPEARKIALINVAKSVSKFKYIKPVTRLNRAQRRAATKARKF